MGAVLLGWPLSANAQLQMCNSRADTVKNLEERFKEKTVAIGLAANGQVMEVWASEYGETYTIIITDPQGHSCMIASGEAWQILPVDYKTSRSAISYEVK